MRSCRLRIGIAACFYYSGLVHLIRWWTQRSGDRLIILNYHRAASGGNLGSHLRYLQRYYRILHLEAALEELYTPHKEAQNGRDRRTMLVLTFDDGYYDNYSHAFALASELKVPMTIFLVPGYIEDGHNFWWLESSRLVNRAQTRVATIEEHTYQLDHGEERRALFQTIDIRLRHASSVAEREELLASLSTVLQASSLVVGDERLALPLTWAQVQEMKKSRWISFGAHTMYHPVLSYLTDPADLQFEVEQCRVTLEKQLGQPIRTFAYPLGKLEHIGDNVRYAVQQAGYDWAVTTISGSNTIESDPYLLKRRNIDVRQHWLVVAAETTGMWIFFSRIFRRLRVFIRRLRTAISSRRVSKDIAQAEI